MRVNSVGKLCFNGGKRRHSSMSSDGSRVGVAKGKLRLSVARVVKRQFVATIDRFAEFNGVFITSFNVIIRPTRELVLLDARKPSAFNAIENNKRKDSTTNEVNKVVMSKIHSAPPDPKDVADKDRGETGEKIAQEEGFHNGRAGVKGRKGAKDLWRSSEGPSVHVKTENLVNAREAAWRARHGIVCGLKTVEILVPRRSTREEDLDSDTNEVHPTKGKSKAWESFWGSKNKENCSKHKRSAKVDEAIRNPSQDIKKAVSFRGQNIAEVTAVKNSFKSRKNTNIDSGTPVMRDEFTSVEKDEPNKNGKGIKEELRGERNQDG